MLPVSRCKNAESTLDTEQALSQRMGSDQVCTSIYLDPARLVQMLAAVTGQAEPEIIQRILQENRNLGSTVWRELQSRQIVPYRWSNDLTEFYQTTSAFLFESLVWNRSSLKQQMRNWILDFVEREFRRPCRLLVFGDGMGFDSTCFAQAGHQVSYFEVSGKAFEFAKLLFEYCRCDVDMLTEITQLKTGQYDVVICLDVLEHIPAPAATVELLAAALAPDGRLIVHAPFWYLAPSVGTHLAANRRFSGDTRWLYRAQGLRPTDASLAWNPIAMAKSSSTRYPSWQARWRLAVGGGLLSIGRYWSTPHVMITKWMLARSLGPWLEMERLAEGQSCSS